MGRNTPYESNEQKLNSKARQNRRAFEFIQLLVFCANQNFSTVTEMGLPCRSATLFTVIVIPASVGVMLDG